MDINSKLFRDEFEFWFNQVVKTNDGERKLSDILPRDEAQHAFARAVLVGVTATIERFAAPPEIVGEDEEVLHEY